MSRNSPKNYFIYILSSDSQILIESKTEYFPWTSVSCFPENSIDTSWRNTTETFLKKIFRPKEDSDAPKSEDWSKDLARSCKLTRILRLWYPVSKNQSVFLQRHIFWRKLSADEKKSFTPFDDFAWVDIETVSTMMTLDSETLDIVNKLIKNRAGDLGFKAQEFQEDNFISDPDDSSQDSDLAPSNPQLALTTAAQFGREEQVLVYREFFGRCLPQLFMKLDKFGSLMMDLGWEKSAIDDLFRCFKQTSTNNPHYLTYNELITGLAICQPMMPHGNYAGEMRCRYMFKYYDKNGDNKINFEEFCNMVKDIRFHKGMSTNKEDITSEAALTASVFGGDSVETLSLNDFLIGVGQLKFRGTSFLLRSPMSVVSYLKRKYSDDVTSKEEKSTKKKRRKTSSEDDDDEIDEKGDGVSKNDVTDLLSNRNRHPSLASESSLPSFLFSFDSDGEVDTENMNTSVANFNSDDEKYEFATHVIKVRRSGQVSGVQSLWELEGGATSASAQFSSSLRFQFGRMASMSAFNVSSDANEMIKGLRYFEKTSKTDPTKKPLSWGIVELPTVASSLISICRQVKNLMIQEPRLLKIKAPVYVLGDIHGNFRDLVCFEKSLWRMGTNITPSNFLFLGDYVDRGEFGVEVVAYLFSQKIISPTKFHLLRGNHEDRSIQKSFTFYKECLAKFGPELGKEVWEEVNQAFDVMPIAAVVDGKIFCVHGGIPPPWLGKNINCLNQVATNLPDPEKQEPLVWEYLWNDPIPGDPMNIPESVKLKLDSEESCGFVDNYHRGTGHMFTVRALDDFLSRNNLSLVIRAHEVKPSGFQVQLKQKLITVFSSSKYCNGSNEAACVLIDNKKLRVIRLDTS